MSNWTAASSDCSRPANNYVRVNTVDLYTPNALFTPERLGYQVLTLFGKLGYSRILDLERGSDARLTYDPTTGKSVPTWTSDGRRIAFGATLSWKAVDGTGAVEPLAENDGRRRNPKAFFRDGTRLLFEYAERGIGVVSLEGDRTETPLREITTHRERNADLSPDERWIAYESNELGPFDVWVRPFPNVNDGERKVSTGGGTWPLWNPAGEPELYYVGPQGMMAVTFETEPTFAAGTLRLLFDTTGYGTSAAPSIGGVLGENRRLDIHPNGERFLMYKLPEDTDVPTEVVLVQHWHEDLKRLVPID